MYSVSMTARLGLAAVVGTMAVIVLAGSKDQISLSGKDQASIPQCKAENCAVGTKIDQIRHKKALKSTQPSDRSADGQMILNKRDKSVQAIAVTESADQPVIKKPARRWAKNPPQRLVENPPQPPVEKSQSRRLRRADDPFLESFN